MKTLLPTLIAALFLFAPAFPYIQELVPNKQNDPEIPFHTPAYTEGKTLPRHIEEDVTIGPEDGIILINTTITIKKGNTLRIKPGTTIAVAEYGGIQVLGVLDAQGDTKNPISFISNELNEKNRNWTGITYAPTGSGIIRNALFYHASPAITCSVPGGVTIANNRYLFGNLELYGPC